MVVNNNFRWKILVFKLSLSTKGVIYREKMCGITSQQQGLVVGVWLLPQAKQPN